MATLCSGRPCLVGNIAIIMFWLAATASWVTHAHEVTDFTVVPYSASQAPSAQPEAGCYQRSYCSCRGCPASHQCTFLKAWGKTYPTCSNVFTQAPTLPIGQVTLDNDLCEDWATSKALYLGPMYEGGDCSKKRLGALYGLYDCSSKRVCLKATSCVRQTRSLYDDASEQDVSADNNPPGRPYNCPGVGCGCYDNNQARAQCSQIDYSPRSNWYYLTQLCDKTTDRTQSNIPVGRYPGPGGVRSGWEDCWPVGEDVTMSVQAHFSVYGRSVDNQRSDIRPHYIQFKTPRCPIKCSGVNKPALCPSSTVVTCKSGQKASAFIASCRPSSSQVTYSFSASGSLSVNPDGSFTCPTNARTITVGVRDMDTVCYSYTVEVKPEAPVPVKCNGVKRPPRCADKLLVTCKSSETKSALIGICRPSNSQVTYSFTSSDSLTVHPDGRFTCPTTAQTITVSVKDQDTVCYLYTAEVKPEVPSGPAKCSSVKKPATCADTTVIDCESDKQASALVNSCRPSNSQVTYSFTSSDTLTVGVDGSFTCPATAQTITVSVKDQDMVCYSYTVNVKPLEFCGTFQLESPVSVCPGADVIEASIQTLSIGVSAVTATIFCPGLPSSTEQVPGSGPMTTRGTVQCSRPASGWQDGERIEVELFGVPGSPCQPVSAVAVLEVVSIEIELEGTPNPICYGATEVSATFRVTADDTDTSLSYQAEAADSSCTITVTDAGSENLVSVTCSKNGGYTSDTVDVLLYVSQPSGLCDETSKQLIIAVNVESPPTVSLSPAASQPISVEGCGDTATLEAFFMFNIEGNVFEGVDVTAETDVPGATCFIDDATPAAVGPTATSGIYKVACSALTGLFLWAVTESLSL